MNRQIVLLRHGESEWNKRNLFTGWVDVGLSEKGREEASAAGRLLKEGEFSFDLAFTSVLKRAEDTLSLVLAEMGLDVPVMRSWRLNERHYGALQGKDKAETLAKYGEEMFLKWRRSYDVPPPPVEPGSEYDQSADPKYAELERGEIPKSESLKDVEARTMPYWEQEIMPRLKEGKRIIVSAHGNSLRAILKNLMNMDGAEIAKMEIPTGVPLVVNFDDNASFAGMAYLGDPEDIKKRQEAVRNQGK